MLLVGIDPGKTGGYAVFKDDKLIELIAVKPSKDPEVRCGYDRKQCRELFQRLSEEHDDFKKIVYVEKVWGMPREGAKSIHTFGFVNGCLYSIPECYGFRVIDVLPRAWQKIMLVKRISPKDGAKETAKRLYPKETFLATSRSRVVHQGLIDAAMIGHYGLSKELVRF